MIPRRTFLTALGAALTIPSPAISSPSPRGGRKKMAMVTTEWRYGSHAWHMGERFLVGYPIQGQWHMPDFQVVSVYVDQTPADDLSRKWAAEFGFTVYPTIAEALRCGGSKLAVDAVLTIGEHGHYPRNERGQTLYPRYEFFKQVTEVFKRDGRTVPVFNDKHLSWKWEWAKEMVESEEAGDEPRIAQPPFPKIARPLRADCGCTAWPPLPRGPRPPARKGSSR